MRFSGSFKPLTRKYCMKFKQLFPSGIFSLMQKARNEISNNNLWNFILADKIININKYNKYRIVFKIFLPSK